MFLQNKQASYFLARLFKPWKTDVSTIKQWYQQSRSSDRFDTTLFYLTVTSCLALCLPLLPFLNFHMLQLPLFFGSVVIVIRLFQKPEERYRLYKTFSRFPYLIIALFIVYIALHILKYQYDAGGMVWIRLYFQPLFVFIMLFFFIYMEPSQDLTYNILLRPLFRIGMIVATILFLVISVYNFGSVLTGMSNILPIYPFKILNIAIEIFTILLFALLLVSSADEKKYIFVIMALVWLVSLSLVGSSENGNLIVKHPKEVILIGLPVSLLIYFWSQKNIQLAALLLFGFIALLLITAPFTYQLVDYFMPSSSNASGLLYNIADRTAIWNKSALNAMEAPWFGRGIQSSKIYGNLYVPWVSQSGNKVYNHPHNLFLQVWNDLGLAGIIFLLVPLYYLYDSFVRLQIGVRKSAGILATYSMICINLLVTHSMWSTWWLNFLLLTFVLIKKLTEPLPPI